MKKINKMFSLLALAATLVMPGAVSAHENYYHKVQMGDTFTYFDLEDTNYQRWVSSYMRNKPVIMLTGHRYQKYEIAKWADAFAQEFQNTNRAYVLWIVNLSKSPWTTSRETILQQWRTFYSSVPILMDWDGVVGKSLKINYNVPNIIVLDSYGRLVMHEMHTFSPQVYNVISQKISPYCSYMKLKKGKYKKGRRGDSN